MRLDYANANLAGALYVLKQLQLVMSLTARRGMTTSLDLTGLVVGKGAN